LRTVLEEIVVTVEPGQLLLKLHWNGGDHTALAVLKNRVGQHRWKTSPATEQLIDDLARVAPDQSIAAILNRLGMRTGKGHTWTQQRVRSFRNDHGIEAYRDGERAERGEVTLEEAAGRLGVSRMTVIRLIKDRSLPAKQTCAGAPYVIRETDLDLPTVRRLIESGRAASQDPRQGTLVYQ
jgi:excisionase family DNA binding protein